METIFRERLDNQTDDDYNKFLREDFINFFGKQERWDQAKLFDARKYNWTFADSAITITDPVSKATEHFPLMPGFSAGGKGDVETGFSWGLTQPKNGTIYLLLLKKSNKVETVL